MSEARIRTGQTIHDRWLVAVLAVVAFFAWLGKRDVTTSHEARVGQTARVMAAAGWPWAATPAEVAAFEVRGDAEGQFAVPRFDLPPRRVNPWLVPVLNGQIRLQKPPLPNWCVATLYRLIGTSEFATRFPPAMFAAIATLLVADLARRTLGRAAARVAGLVWVSTLFLVAEHRESTPDPYLTFFTLAAVWAWVRGSSRRRGARLLVVAFYVSLGFGILAKGPFVLLHVAIALGAYAWSNSRRRRRPPAGVAVHLLGVLLMLAIALPWPIYIATSVEHAGALWRMEATRGGGGGLGRTLLDAWGYLPRMAEITLPWTPLWLVGIVSAARRRGTRRRRLFPLVWTIVTVAAFSVSAEKKNAYLMPMLPAQTLLVTAGFLTLAGTLRAGKREAWPKVVMAAQLVVTAGIAGVGVWTLWGWGGRVDVFAGLALAGAALGLLIAAAVRTRNPGVGDVRKWLVRHSVAATLACLLTGVVANASRDNARSAKTFARGAASLVVPPANVLVPRLPAEASFYLPMEVRYDPRAAEVFSIVEPTGRKPFNVADYRPPLPHGRVAGAVEIPVPGQPPNAHWRLVRLTVEPPTASNVTGP